MDLFNQNLSGLRLESLDDERYHYLILYLACVEYKVKLIPIAISTDNRHLKNIAMLTELAVMVTKKKLCLLYTSIAGEGSGI